MAGCDLLLDLGARINLYGVRGKNALQAASSRMELLLVQFLLDQGADVNAPAHDDGGRTALQAALEHGYDDIVKCLLDAKADVRAPPAKQRGMTVLEAFAHQHLTIFSTRALDFNMVPGFRDWLSRGAPINRPDGDHGNVLHLLIRNHLKPIIECLDIALQAGARIEDKDRFSRGQKTPLQVAAEVGDIGAVRLLLNYGAQINAPPDDEFGRTALTGGITALQGAAISGNINIAKQLLDHGADVNAAPAVEEGRTAIEGAAEHGRLDMVRFLISAGAVGDTEKGFSRAIELAEDENHFTVADFLRDQQDLSAGFSTEMDDMLGGDIFSPVPMQGFVLSDENWANFTFQ
ncbi:ankyrin repeat-containing domain protein [Colletotrichum navitas]|uniref:Ankyrin repeat-containing domain protein n=1 Tax=Colletotrichum navitas TaxID=681940 RepID=A0AAD8Q6M2_9PEZI|nr:ankyrin repeat-containing domain protein [Colletotrichum navitas]KAK1596710.1 ankyrin repeat-containing domain protein [Colletotrichum navitas]